MTWAQLEEQWLSSDIRRVIAELRDTRPYDGRRVTLLEKRSGWRFTGLSGICTRLAVDKRRMVLLVEHDPENHWPLGMEILAELDNETVPEFFDRHPAVEAMPLREQASRGSRG